MTCDLAEGSIAEDVLAFFEQSTGESFTDTPGVLLTTRVRGIARVLSNLAKEASLSSPLVSHIRRSRVV